MDIQIRKAEIKDAPAIAALLRSLGWFADINDETPHITQERVVRQLALCNADGSHSVFVAQFPLGEIIGYSSVHWLPTSSIAWWKAPSVRHFFN